MGLINTQIASIKANVSKRTINNWIKQKHITAVKDGLKNVDKEHHNYLYKWMIDEDSLNEYIKSKKESKIKVKLENIIDNSEKMQQIEKNIKLLKKDNESLFRLINMLGIDKDKIIRIRNGYFK